MVLEQIRGRVKEVMPGYLIVEVEGTGIGLGVHVLFPFSEKVRKGTRVSLHTLLYTHPGGWMLFGFAERREREWFERLLEVPRVGVLLARRLLSELSVEQLVRVLATEDVDTLISIKGVGRRTALRLVSLLKDEARQEEKPVASLPASSPEEIQFAIKALVQMGMNRKDARNAVAKVLSEKNDLNAAEIVMRVLRSTPRSSN